MVDNRILGCKRAYARLHPKIRPFSRQILENHKFRHTPKFMEESVR